jgi:hypothetical protein
MLCAAAGHVAADCFKGPLRGGYVAAGSPQRHALHRFSTYFIMAF